MTPTITVGETETTVRAGGVEIARYVHRPEAPASEGAKPYLHPLRTLDGAIASAYRPWDHRWHKGLQMTWTHVSGENFWGGPTYSRDEGYVLRDNVGTIRHERFTEVVEEEGEARFTEELVWATQAGADWIAETRTHRFHGVDPARGLWVLDFATTLRNISGRELELGSPTTEGRPGAGYTGFVLRMPRAWTGGTVVTPAGEGADAAMGRPAPWLALTGEHDEVDGAATVIVYAGSSTAPPALKWFVRSEPFPVVSPSPAFDEKILLPDGGALSLSHRHVFADRAWSGDELHALAEELQP